MARRLVMLAMAAVLGLAALGCSSSDDKKATDSPSTTRLQEQQSTTLSLDLGGLVDTPECQSFAEVGRLLEQASNATDPNAQAALLPDLKAAFAQATTDAPEEIRPDVELVNGDVQGWSAFAEILQQPPEVAAASGRMSTWIETNCGFDPTPVG